MFTGIVRGTGVVESFLSDKLRVRMRWAKDVKVGDSVCINGVCLTAVEVGEDFCVFDVMEETRKRSNLGALRRGDVVNIEGRGAFWWAFCDRACGRCWKDKAT